MAGRTTKTMDSVDLEDLLAGDRTTTVTFPSGRKGWVRYNPQRITGDMLMLVSSVAGLNDTESLPVVAEFLEQVLLGWNLTRSGEPIGLHSADLLSLPIPVLMAVLLRIQMEQTPDPKLAAAS